MPAIHSDLRSHPGQLPVSDTAAPFYRRFRVQGHSRTLSSPPVHRARAPTVQERLPTMPAKRPNAIVAKASAGADDLVNLFAGFGLDDDELDDDETALADAFTRLHDRFGGCRVPLAALNDALEELFERKGVSMKKFKKTVRWAGQGAASTRGCSRRCYSPAAAVARLGEGAGARSLVRAASVDRCVHVLGAPGAILSCFPRRCTEGV